MWWKLIIASPFLILTLLILYSMKGYKEFIKDNPDVVKLDQEGTDGEYAEDDSNVVQLDQDEK